MLITKEELLNLMENNDRIDNCALEYILNYINKELIDDASRNIKTTHFDELHSHLKRQIRYQKNYQIVHDKIIERLTDAGYTVTIKTSYSKGLIIKSI
jgi:hypothetical protein